jgi:phosphonate transport system substrate-binding protein
VLRFRTYLAPSVPEAFFVSVRDRLAALTGEEVELSFDARTSGPLDPEDNPFVRREIDFAFVCAPSYLALREVVRLVAAPVPTDPRAHGLPLYFSDVVVRDDVDLRTARWALNDGASLSGYRSVVEAYGVSVLERAIVSGSHLASLDLVASGEADAAAIDSNVLRLNPRPLRVAATLGPFPIQPVVARAELPVARLSAAFLSLGSFEMFGFAGFASVDPSHFTPRNDSGYEALRC